MKYLVSNGCSLTAQAVKEKGWDDLLGKNLGVEKVHELSESGSSNDGIFRRTYNWLISSDIVKDSMVVIQLTDLSKERLLSIFQRQAKLPCQELLLKLILRMVWQIK